MSKGSEDSGYARAGRLSTSEISSAHYLDLSVSFSTNNSSTALGWYSRIRYNDNRSIDSSDYVRIKEDLSSSIQTTSTGHYVKILDDVGRSSNDQRHHPFVRKDVTDLKKPRQCGKRPLIIGFVILLVIIVISGVVAAVVANFALRKETTSLSLTTSPLTETFTVEGSAPRTTPKPILTETDTTSVKPPEAPRSIPVFNNTGFHRDCKELLANGSSSDGVFTIYPYLPTPTAVRVFCDMTTDGGGWTTFQHRRDGTVDFYKLWDPYKNGFGDASGEYWLGNDHLHQLTSLGSSDFYVRLEKFTGDWAFAKYNELTVANETGGYRLKVKFNSYQGNAGDCFQSHLSINSQGYKFSTPDVDNDFASSSCAIAHRGAWWYNNCGLANLNGYYNSTKCSGNQWCNYWYYLTNNFVNVKTSYMMVRRV